MYKSGSATTEYYKQGVMETAQKTAELLAMNIGNEPDEEGPVPMDTQETTKEGYTVLFNANVPGGPVIKLEELQKLEVLGQGISGYVDKCIHLPSKTLVALKVRVSTSNLCRSFQ